MLSIWMSEMIYSTANRHSDILIRLNKNTDQRISARKKNLAQCLQAKLSNDTEIARAKRDFELKKASYDIEVRLIEIKIMTNYK